MLASTVAAGLVVAPAPASAISIHPGATSTFPETWVDDAGRQYVVTSGYQENHVLVARDTPSGAPDALWGTFDGVPGLRTVTIAPPVPGAVRDPDISLADGILTTIWWLPTCNLTCTRWFVRTAVDGTPVGTPVERPEVQEVFDVVDDGSFIGVGPGYVVRWLAPDGALRAEADIGRTQVRGTAIDGSGRLLVATSDGMIRRLLADGTSDLTLDTGCALYVNNVVAADTDDDGFAYACGANDAADLTVTRYDADGEVEWSTTGAPTASASIARPTAIAIDDTDQIWVAGTGLFTAPPSEGGMTIGISGLATFTEGGAPVARYQRPLQTQGNADLGGSGISDLRPVPGGHVAYADFKRCCQTIGGGEPNDDVFGAVLPARPAEAVPTCTPADLAITGAGHGSISVTFTGCPAPASGPAPTGYAVTSGSKTAAAPAPASPSTPITLTLDGLDPYRLAQVTARAVNDGGPSTAAAPTVTTVLPFTSTDAFVQRQYADLVGRAPTAQELASARGTANEPGDSGAATVASGLLATGRATKAVEPTARLYRSYFLRDPDLAGLRYWVARREAGRTLTWMSDSFSRSPEFARRYGTLSNKAFVEQLYANVFSRPGDPAGVAFWTKRIDQHRLSRGGVVLQFSESTEGLRKAAPRVEPIAATFLMLDRLPTSLERASWTTSTRPSTYIPRVIVGSEEYADRVAQP